MAGSGAVFVSRTSDLASYPAGGSFADSALRGIVRAGRRPVDMRYFAARDQRPAEYCRQRVRNSAIYVAVIGFRYGSLVPDEDYSYTELEFRTATEAGIPRLVFLLDEDAPIPRRLVDRDSSAIDAFRERLRTAGVVCQKVDQPAALELAVYQALSEVDDAADRWAAYRTALIGRYRHLDLDALAPHDRTPVLLRSVFVPPQVRADPHGQPIPALEAVAGRRVVLLGDPGSGKSTLARYVALTTPDTLVVELRSYAPWAREDSLLEYVERQYRHELPRGELVRHLDAGQPALLVCDGVDELFDPPLREAVTRQIAATAARWPNLRVLVTARVVGYRRSLLENAGFAHFVLEDFDDARVDEFVTAWHRTSAYRRTRLLDAIRASPSVRELAGNPLLLTILALADNRPEPPRNRTTVYAQAASVLVHHWDADRHLRDARVDADHLDLSDRFALLERAAARMQGGRIARGDLLAEFRAYLAERYADPPDRTKVLASALIDQFVERNFILARTGAGVYGFVHRAFFEYFAAAALSVQDVRTIYGDHWSDPEWHGVLLLLAGRLDERALGEAIDQLLGVDPLWWLRPEALPRHLMLAIACLGEARGGAVGSIDALGERATRALLLALVNTSSPAEFERAVVPALSRTWPGRGLFRDWFLAHWLHLPPAQQGTAVRFFGALFAGDDAAHDLLRGLATSPRDAAAAAVDAVAANWTSDPDVPTWLYGRAGVQSPVVRAAAVRALARYWPDDATVRTLLRDRALADDAGEVRAAAVRALARRSPDADEDWAVLRVVATADGRSSVRRDALEAVARRWPDDPRMRQLLEERAVSDADAGARYFAVAEIARRWPREPATRALLIERAREDSLAGTHAAAALREHWGEGRADEPRPADRETAAADVLCDDERRDADALISVHWTLESEHRWLWVSAVHALADRWPDDPATLPTLATLAVERGATADARRSAVELLAARWPHRPGIRALLVGRAVGDPATSVRSVALGGLAQAWPDDETRLVLLERASGDAHEDVRTLALQVLAALWPNDPDVVRVLRERAAGRPTRDRDVAGQLLAVRR